jgi:hypothetical protein
MAKLIADSGRHVVATDLIWHDDCVFPVVGGVDALQAPLPAGVQAIVTNPPYRRDLLPQLVAHWLRLSESVGGQLCLLLRTLWGESQSGQQATTRHPAYAGRIKLPKRIRWFEGTEADNGGSPQHDHAWLVWDWNRDATKLPFEVSAGDSRLRTGCAVCGGSLAHLRAGARTCPIPIRILRRSSMPPRRECRFRCAPASRISSSTSWRLERFTKARACRRWATRGMSPSSTSN